jgi:phospholipase C
MDHRTIVPCFYFRRILITNDSLFILNFDEHGGFADHVPPPVNVPQPQDGIDFNGLSDGHNVTYDFTRLGVR